MATYLFAVGDESRPRSRAYCDNCDHCNNCAYCDHCVKEKTLVWGGRCFPQSYDYDENDEDKMMVMKTLLLVSYQTVISGYYPVIRNKSSPTLFNISISLFGSHFHSQRVLRRCSRKCSWNNFSLSFYEFSNKLSRASRLFLLAIH